MEKGLQNWKKKSSQQKKKKKSKLILKTQIKIKHHH